MPNFKVFQIFYDQTTKDALDPGFIPLDNTENLRPDWFELWPIRRYFTQNEMVDGTWYGFLSPRFGTKTGLPSANLLDFLAAVDGQADVALVSYAWDAAAYFLNAFEQGEVSHPGLLEVSQRFLGEQGLRVDLRSHIGHTQNTVFGNFFVAKPPFWRRWLRLAEALFQEAERNASRIGKALNETAPYLRAAPMKAFVQERLACALLAEGGQRASTLDTTGYAQVGPDTFPPDLYTRHQLLACNLLKIEYVLRRDPAFLETYKKLRRNIRTLLPFPPLP